MNIQSLHPPSLMIGDEDEPQPKSHHSFEIQKLIEILSPLISIHQCFDANRWEEP